MGNSRRRVDRSRAEMPRSARSFGESGTSSSEGAPDTEGSPSFEAEEYGDAGDLERTEDEESVEEYEEEDEDEVDDDEERTAGSVDYHEELSREEGWERKMGWSGRRGLAYAHSTSSESRYSGESEREQSPEIRVTLTATESVDQQRTGRRKSIASPRLSRQEALTSYPIEIPATATIELFGAPEEEAEKEDEEEADVEDDEAEGATARRSRGAGRLVVRDIFLTVPELKRDRAASVDSCFNGNKTENADQQQNSLVVPQQTLRSKSVDIVLPTDVQTRYTTLLPPTESRPLRR